MTLARPSPSAAAALHRLPRIGFLGLGWIGRNRMEAMLATGLVEVAAVADTVPENAAAAALLAPAAERVSSLEALLDSQPDGIVIATPSALHAWQSIAALERGIPVFCQKPLGRDLAEVRAVIEAARDADRLLGVDLSYRGTAGMRVIRERVRGGDLGTIHAVDLTFHNAYGPDKSWFYDPGLSGGGCMMDLGVHLIDLALWTLDFPRVEAVEADLFSQGKRIADRAAQVEDYAIATLRLVGGAAARVACSWNLHAGQDAVIAAEFYGDRGGAAFRNVGGSFYDFEAQLFHGTRQETLSPPGDAWGGQMACAWARQLARSPRFDPACENFARAAGVLDAIYGGSRNYSSSPSG
jgi:predicted dehydrogenase